MCAARVIVTRPAREGARWIADLRRAGLDAVSLPLIAIEAVEGDPALDAARRQASGCDALMFVSASAVEHFFREDVRDDDVRRARGVRFWCTGPGTARALRQSGVPPGSIDEPAGPGVQFDSEALWAAVRSQVRPGARVLIVRGADATGRIAGRNWLAGEIVAAGAEVDEVASYRRLPVLFGEPERRVVLDASRGAAIWLFSSSEAIANLRAAEPALKWEAAKAVATHERIASAAHDAGFVSVQVCRPTLPEIVASIESFS